MNAHYVRMYPHVAIYLHPSDILPGHYNNAQYVVIQTETSPYENTLQSDVQQ